MTARDRKHLSAEALSAYLDGQVTPRERRSVEAHLRACPQCAQQFHSLKHTVSLLRQVPPVAAPRPFTLREMDVRPARPRRRPWLLPYLQGATALATLLLVVLVAGDLLLGLGHRPASAPAPAAVVATQVVEKAVVEREALTMPPTPSPVPLVAEELEAPQVAEVLSEEATPETPAAPPMPEAEKMVREAPAPADTPTGGPMMQMMGQDAEEETPTASPSAPPGMGGGEAWLEATPAPPTTATEAALAAAPTAPAMATEEAALAAAPTAPQEPSPSAVAVQMTVPAPEATPQPTGAFHQAAPWRDWLRLAELGLLGLVLALGGATLLLRRR